MKQFGKGAGGGLVGGKVGGGEGTDYFCTHCSKEGNLFAITLQPFSVFFRTFRETMHQGPAAIAPARSIWYRATLNQGCHCGASETRRRVNSTDEAAKQTEFGFYFGAGINICRGGKAARKSETNQRTT